MQPPIKINQGFRCCFLFHQPQFSNWRACCPPKVMLPHSNQGHPIIKQLLIHPGNKLPGYGPKASQPEIGSKMGGELTYPKLEWGQHELPPRQRSFMCLLSGLHHIPTARRAQRQNPRPAADVFVQPPRKVPACCGPAARTPRCQNRNLDPQKGRCPFSF